MKVSIIIFFFFLLICPSPGVIKASGVGRSPLNFLHHKGGVYGKISRKLMGINAVLDYDYAGPNPKHDPRGKRGGGGSRSP